MKNEIILSDEFEKLKERINFLKAEVARLTEEKQELEQVECPKIKAEFMERIGDHTNHLVLMELKIQELKYRIMLAQAAINRAEQLKIEQMEEKVSKEYEEYHKKVEEKFKEAEEAKEQAKQQKEKAAEQEERYYQRQEEKKAKQKEAEGTNPETDETSAGKDKNTSKEAETEPPVDEFAGMSFKQKVKELYRRIVKKLHPDMNPDVTERQKELWHKAQKAYGESDLETLEDIYDEINRVDADTIPETEDGREKLLLMIERLERQLKELVDAIAQIKSEFPYNKKELLADEEKVNLMRAAIEKVRIEYEKQIEELTAKLEKLLEKLNAK